MTSYLLDRQLVIRPGLIVIAVIWQKPKSDLSELYHYTLPDSFGETDALIRIQGKRIGSLSEEMGGIHKMSLLRQQNHTKTGHYEGLLGDIQVSSFISPTKYVQGMNMKTQVITVLGPSDKTADPCGGSCGRPL